MRNRAKQWVQKMSADSEAVASARMRRLDARRELNGTVDQVRSRMKPWAVAGYALSRTKSAHFDWLKLGLTLYRFRAPALAAASGIAGMVARRKEKYERRSIDMSAGAASKGVSDMTANLKESLQENVSGLKDGAAVARDKAREVADIAARKAREAGETISDKAGAVYVATQEKSTQLGEKLADGVRNNPVTAIAGGIAMGVLIGALLPRSGKDKGEAGRYRSKMSETAQDALHAIRGRLDDVGINRAKAQATLIKAKDVAVDATSQVASAARDALQKARRG